MGRRSGRDRWTLAGTASAVELRPLVAYAESVGVDVDAILRAIELPRSALDDYDHRISERQRAHAWVEAARVSGDPAFGLHAARVLRLGDFDVLGYAVALSPTLGAALDQIIRFHRLMCDAWVVVRQETRTGVVLRRLERTPPHEAEAVAAALTLAARSLTRRLVVPRRVSFAHAPPPSTKEHQKLFRCPLRFGGPANEIEFPRSVEALPVRTSNPGVVAVLNRYMIEDLSKLPSGRSFIEHVRAAVTKTLREGGRPVLESTAHQMHASPRTIQRRLEEHGTTHSELVDAVRRELAQRLLERRELSIAEVAFLAGFTDISGFRRGYRRWTGRYPARRPAHPR